MVIDYLTEIYPFLIKLYIKFCHKIKWLFRLDHFYL